ncbi:LamG domain-containing protein, partial [bacterium]|nr:LamG domain-containing protein [bacterium]
KTITAGSGVSVQAFSPFAPTASYSASTVGGSGYFDGSGDYLVTPSNANLSSTLLGSDFTIECWLYLTSNPSGGAPIWTNSVSNSDGFSSAYVTSTGTIGTGKVGTNEFATTATVVLNAWNHFATVRSGATVYTYLNGVQAASGAASTYLNTSATKPIQIAQSNQTSPANLTGYISGYRITTAAQYTGSTYTIPTAPPTAISGTNLLLNFTNGGITDATAKNDLETVGNAQISTTQSKFGGSSMYFDGNGDYLYIPPAQNLPFLFGSGDFTVEAWVYPSAVTGYQYFCSVWGIAGQADSTYSSWQLRTNATNLEAVLQSGATTTVITGSGTSLTATTWQHIAMTRYGNTIKLFINGFQVASQSYSSTLNSPASAFVVGLQLSNNNAYTGYIDDLRITKGIARYTSNFTPPTSAFLTL